MSKRNTVPRYTEKGWAEMKARNGYVLTPREKGLLGLGR